VQSLHGDREQCDREQALDDFKKGRFVPKLGLNEPVLLRLIICRTFSIVLCPFVTIEMKRSELCMIVFILLI